MKKIIKILAWTSVAGLLALAVAAVGLKLYFTPERLKAMALEYADKSLGREVTFDAVKLSLSGVSITNLRVSESPDFKKGEFLSAAAFAVRPALRPLLSRKIVINSISADGLKMRVVEVKKNVYNFSDLIAAVPAAAAKPADKTSATPSLAISSLKVRGSRFSYNNATGDMWVALRDINLTASGISPEGFFPLEADFSIDAKSPYFTGTVPASIKGRVDMAGWNIEKGQAQLGRVSLELGGLKAEIKGSLKNLLEPDAKLSVSVKPFSTSDLKKYFKDLPPAIQLPALRADADFKMTLKDIDLRTVAFSAGPAKGTLKGHAGWEPKVTYSLAVDLNASTPEIDTSVLARDMKLSQVPAGYKLPQAAILAKLTVKDGAADITSFSLKTAALGLDGRALVNFGGVSLRSSGSAKAEIKDLSKLAAIAPALLAPYALSGAAGADLDYNYAGEISIKGKATLGGIGAVVAEHKLTGLSGNIEFSKDSVTARTLEGKLDGQDLKASFTGRDLLKHPKADFDFKLAKLTLKDLPPAQAAAGHTAAEKKPAAGEPFYLDIAGRAEIGAIEHPNFRCGTAAMNMALVNISDDLKALGGSASFTVGAGKFSELYVLAGRYKAAKVALYPLLVLQKASKLAKTLRLPDFNNIAFDLIEGDYSFEKGVMKLSKSALKSSVADVTSSGSINLPAEKLDMKINTTMKEGSGMKMSEPVGMLVKGTFADPSVKPDLKSIAEQPVVKKAIEKALPGASKFLKGLFKK